MSQRMMSPARLRMPGGRGGSDSLPAAFLSEPAATSRRCGRKKKRKNSAALARLRPANSWCGELEFYYWEGAAKTGESPGDLAGVTSTCTHVFTYTHARTHTHVGSELLPQVINTCPETL